MRDMLDVLDVTTERCRLAPVTPADRSLVRGWLRQPEVQRWWGSTASAEAEIAMALDSESAICRMIIEDDKPIGYAHAIDMAHLHGPLPPELPAGTYDCDLFIGAPGYRGRGIGQAALELLVTEVFTTTLAVACGIVVSIRNERAARAYEKAGFRWQRVWQDPVFGPSWVMLRDRP